MSSYTCETCKTDILDTPRGYITECEHHPKEKKNSNFSDFFRNATEEERREVFTKVIKEANAEQRKVMEEALITNPQTKDD